MKFNLFISYTRTPDGPLAREVERFLEAFHQTPLPVELATALPPLQVCLDGSDFSLPPLEEDASDAARRDVLGIIYSHLAQSRELLVLGSRGTAQSEWVDKEVRWFLDHAGPARVRLAFTEGNEPWAEPDAFFPPSVIEQKLHEGIAYDLRGYDKQRAQGWRQVPEFQREMVRLAADLSGYSAGDLYPSWLEAELVRVRRESLTLASTARFETLAGDPSRALLRAYEAHELHPGEATEVALREAYKVAVLHHQNRREMARISGSGPSYLAGRWKQGGVFSKNSHDGKYRLLVTERGKDGPHPPGDVYVVSNETQRATKLVPPEYENNRVEDVAFDRASQQVFVTRYFNLSVYSTGGRRIGGYKFSRHTKSPVHLIDGYFAGQYILGAESKGGIWLVDIKSTDRNSTLMVLPEFSGDAAIFCNISANGMLAALVFESGRSALLSLDESGMPRLAEVASEGVLFAGFAAGRDDRLFTSGDGGAIVMWEIEEGSVRESLRMQPLPTAIDWVSVDEGSKRIAAVGADQKLYLLHQESGELLDTLDHADVIDWAAFRSVSVPAAEVNPGSAVTFDEPIPFPSDTLHVANVQHVAGETWLFTEDPGDSEFSKDRKTYLLKGGSAIPFPYGASMVEAHADILWFRYAPGYGGKAYWRFKDFYRPFPSADLDASCIYEKEGVVWVGTRAGLYRHQGDAHELASPRTMRISHIEEVGGRIWVRSDEGCHVLEGDRLIRVVEPFLKIRAIKEVAGDVWLLTKTDEMFTSDGPAYRVQGYFASPMPDAKAKVSDVLEAGGYTWLATEAALHRVDEAGIRTITGIAPNVEAVFQAGQTLWLTTHTRGFMPHRELAYRMDARTLEPKQLDCNASLRKVADRGWMTYHGKEGQAVVAEALEDGLQELDLEGASVQDFVMHQNELWLLTSNGVFSFSGASPERVDLPLLSYHARVDLAGEIWLLASNAAVRIKPGEPMTIQTGDHRPKLIVRAGGAHWILTGTGDYFTEPGPAYRVAGRSAKAVTPAEGGITQVVEIDGEVWLLTGSAGMTGPMMKA